ncbi:hypothetical protein BV898_06495 [Hypsibius exemplaris]|uniref:Uncharacterized protein n=1 Tax=Hypsibius exemplaris TaxID=2072580 RepID=A0A1W0WWF6_HYPEX|nr:hypothetical protein BV898_06495 [Hypsibius exemplaris]
MAENLLKYRNTHEPRRILNGAIRCEISETCKNVFQSSFGDNNKPIIPSTSGFVYAPLRLATATTDWSFAQTVSRSSSSPSKKELEVTAAGSRYTVDFGNLAEQIGHLIKKNVIDPSLREWIIPDFTTTTSNDKIVSSLVMMATLKAYFSCKMSEWEDWQKLLKRLDKLPSFGKENSQWATLRKPVLTRFVSAFDQPESKENKDFWQTIVHYEGGEVVRAIFRAGSSSSVFSPMKGRLCIGRRNGVTILMNLSASETERMLRRRIKSYGFIWME